MPWFKVDDGFHSHPKAIAAGTPAIGLWTLCGSWSSDQLKDGFVPTAVALRYGTRAMCKALVSAGLWLVVDGGYQFHDWGDRNPLKEQVDAIRDVKRRAGQAGGRASGQTRANGKHVASRNEAACFSPGTAAVAKQTNPQSQSSPVVGGSLVDGPESVDASEDLDHHEEEAKEQLALTVHRLQPTWQIGKIRQVIADAREKASMHRTTAALLIVALAHDSQSPRRVLSPGYWWDENDTRYQQALEALESVA
jgi:hypothetical protein